ncbi:hypothetical protein HK100_006582 [Physocladia obscura]|uniref:Uncharacterized protein n=1 Tax=Physocladia obscura TaxID=109957 RepID=A0AAD5SRN0_9FUNG|nr:hypothetical protein HK100_006582 [Physocladia obscura]
MEDLDQCMNLFTQVVVPLFADQPKNRVRVEETGIWFTMKDKFAFMLCDVSVALEVILEDGNEVGDYSADLESFKNIETMKGVFSHLNVTDCAYKCGIEFAVGCQHCGGCCSRSRRCQG